MEEPSTPPRRFHLPALGEWSLPDSESRQNATRFYDWQTPGKPSQRKKKKGFDVALSHPALRKHDDGTPLSRVVNHETAARDARLGAAYAARRAALEADNQLVECTFKTERLDFKICLGRVSSVDQSTKSTRRRILVEETFPECAHWSTLRPHDELVAVNGDLLIEIDAEAFEALVSRLRSLSRPLKLTFAKGVDRDRAFREQLDRQQLIFEAQRAVPAPPAAAALNAHVSEETQTTPKAAAPAAAAPAPGVDTHAHASETQTTPKAAAAPALSFFASLSCSSRPSAASFSTPKAAAPVEGIAATPGVFTSLLSATAGSPAPSPPVVDNIAAAPAPGVFDFTSLLSATCASYDTKAVVGGGGGTSEVGRSKEKKRRNDSTASSVTFADDLEGGDEERDVVGMSIICSTPLRNPTSPADLEEERDLVSISICGTPVREEVVSPDPCCKCACIDLS